MKMVTVTGDPTISLVIPVYNEQAVLPLLFARLESLADRIEGVVEIVMVDDGSRDGSGVLIADQAERDPRYRYIALSRNFGHQAAITAGMELARGEAVIVMDADLQDPPEVVLSLIDSWRDGNDIVHARRRSRAGETWFKLLTARLFYRVANALSDVDLPADVGDFRLVSRRAIETFRAMPEQDHYVRGMFAWMGYRQAFVDFDRDERSAGETKYPFRRMLKLALNGVVSFSDVPLRMAIWAGSLISLAALAYGAYVVAMAVAGVGLATGWASLAVLVSLLSGINLLMVGIVGIYVGRIHREVKGRPRYIVARDTAERPDAIGADLFASGSIGARLLTGKTT